MLVLALSITNNEPATMSDQHAVCRRRSGDSFVAAAVPLEWVQPGRTKELEPSPASIVTIVPGPED
jgi:hypothetical protein